MTSIAAIETAHASGFPPNVEPCEPGVNTSNKEVRGRGLFIGIELHESARPYCEALKEQGLLCKETHDTVIRFAPPLVITKEELDMALEKIKSVFA